MVDVFVVVGNASVSHDTDQNITLQLIFPPSLVKDSPLSCYWPSMGERFYSVYISLGTQACCVCDRKGDLAAECIRHRVPPK